MACLQPSWQELFLSPVEWLRLLGWVPIGPLLNLVAAPTVIVGMAACMPVAAGLALVAERRWYLTFDQQQAVISAPARAGSLTALQD
jgi:hypothetical protein